MGRVGELSSFPEEWEQNLGSRVQEAALAPQRGQGSTLVLVIGLFFVVVAGCFGRPALLFIA